MMAQNTIYEEIREDKKTIIKRGYIRMKGRFLGRVRLNLL
jgi:hypothetical protein